METQIQEIAERIKGLRQMMEISEEEMARITGVSLADYRAFEAGQRDFPFTFLLECSGRFGVDLVELLTGDNPRLTFYTVVRRGKGLRVARRTGFEYRHLAPYLKNKMAEPFYVVAPYSAQDEAGAVSYSSHEGQEFDYILRGSLKVVLDGHVEVLHEGDSVYYDSGHPHGMVAVGGADCEFLAFVLHE